MTPRQRCAVAFPVADVKAPVHPRHYRVMAPFQTILTFDMFPDEHLPENLKERAINGRCGVWHARISTFPGKKIEDWQAADRTRGSKMLQRLLSQVGIDGKDEIAMGNDGISMHAYRWASTSEVAQAIRASEGKGPKLVEAESPEPEAA